MFQYLKFVKNGGGIVQWYSAGLRASLSGVWLSAGAGNFSRCGDV